MRYEAIINVPGYMPMADEPTVFDTPDAAWSYLADERMRGEESATDGEVWSATADLLGALGESAHWRDGVAPTGIHPLNANGTGTVYGPTPGYAGEHDLGLAYSVQEVHDAGDDA